MADKKITKRERFEQIKVIVADNPDLVEFIDHEIELLSRKASKNGTLTPSQKDTALLVHIVKNILAESESENGMTVGELLKNARVIAFTTHDGKSVSSQKMTSVLSTLTTEDNKGEVIREVIKKVAYYRLNPDFTEVTEGEG